MELQFTRELDALDVVLKHLTPEARANLIAKVTQAIETEVERMLATAATVDTGELARDPVMGPGVNYRATS